MKTKIIFVIAVVALLIISCTDRETFTDPNKNPSIGGVYTEINGSINGVLKKSDSPFYVSGTITVNTSDTLIIEPGTELFFGEASQLIVKGTLVAIGNQQNNISFKPFEIDWQGIHIINTSTESILRNCVISDVYLPQDSLTRKGAVEFTNAAGEIINCYFKYNYTTYGGAIFTDNSSVTIKNNIFYRNYAEVFGGAIFSMNSSNKIYNNFVYRNTCYNTGGGFVFYDAANEDVQNNILYRNLSSKGDTRIAYVNDDSTNVFHQYNFLGSNEANPFFVAEENFHLQTNSPCINNGNPDPLFNDADGSRNDQGTYGGPDGDW
jgi:hypothetical protein